MQYSPEQLLQAEFVLLRVLNFRLKCVTPYCYLKVVKDMLPLPDENPLYKNLSLMLEYCCMFPQFVGLSAAEMLFAVLLTNLKSSNQMEFEAAILGLANRWPSVPLLVKLINTLV